MAVWTLLRETASRFSGHKASLLGAALAYYAVFSLGPLMVIAIAIAGFAFGDEAARGEVSAQLKNLLGDTGAQAVGIAASFTSPRFRTARYSSAPRRRASLSAP
jgi:membrane protein